MAKQEKWREEIEEILDHNRTIDDWIIHDYVWEQPHEHVDPELAKLRQMLCQLFVTMSPYVARLRLQPGSDRERWTGIARLLAEAGCPDEVISEFFRRISQFDLPKPKDDEEQET